MFAVNRKTKTVDARTPRRLASGPSRSRVDRAAKDRDEAIICSLASLPFTGHTYSSLNSGHFSNVRSTHRYDNHQKTRNIILCSLRAGDTRQSLGLWGASCFDVRRSTSDQGKVRKRDNKPSAAQQVVLLPIAEFIDKVPRQNQEVVRLGIPRLLFRDDWDASSHCYPSPFVGIALGSSGD